VLTEHRRDLPPAVDLQQLDLPARHETAEALGLTIPQSILVRADRVIE